MTYTETWQSLETSSVKGGYVRRRVKPEAICGLFLAVAKPSNQHMLHIQLEDVSPPTLSSLPLARGLDVTIRPSGNEQESFIIQLALKESRFAAVFDALISDIIDTLASIQSSSVIITTLMSRLRRWQKFLAQAEPEGLSREAQQGLYGELWFLRECLIPFIGHDSALLAWTGPAGSHHDFLLRSCAIEVKTTGMKEPQQMIIQSERQLDDSGLVALFLFHLAMDIHEGTGESLITMINSLRDMLADDTTALDLYEDHLLEAGFLQTQATYYERTGYHIRNTHLFQVVDGFPRIIEADLKPGVGIVRYSISVAECRHFVVAEDVLKSQLTGIDYGK